MSNVICMTNRKICSEDFETRIRKVAAASPRGIILREKDLTAPEYELLAKKIIKICREYQIPCILHTFYEVALKLGVSAIHLPLPILRSMTKEDRASFAILGASCHLVEEAVEARNLGCTYITAGHIYATDCKKGLPPRGISFLWEICQAVDIPVYAIGGITEARLPEVMEAGAAGGCIMSGFMKNPCVDGAIHV